MTARPTVLALGGGGARGLAHFGVLEVFQDAAIPYDRIVGVSIGSLVGAICAFDTDIRRVQKHVISYLGSPVFQRHQVAFYGTRRGARPPETAGILWFNRLKDYLTANRLVHRVLLRSSFLPGRLLEQVIEALIPDADIADARVPLTIVAVDLRTGTPVALERGPVRRAVMGSAALPGIFPPVELEGRLLADIGVFSSLPTATARTYDPETVIAVNVSPELERIESCDTALDVMMRMEEIGGVLFADYVNSLADIVIRPNVGELEWSDFTTAEAVIEQGRLAARGSLASIRARLGFRATPASNPSVT